MEEFKSKETSIELARGRYETKIKENLQKAFDEEMATLKEQRRALETAEQEVILLRENLEAEFTRKILAAEREVERYTISFLTSQHITVNHAVCINYYNREYSTKYSTLKADLEREDAKRRDDLEAHYAALHLDSERELATRKEDLEREMAARYPHIFFYPAQAQ